MVRHGKTFTESGCQVHGQLSEVHSMLPLVSHLALCIFAQALLQVLRYVSMYVVGRGTSLDTTKPRPSAGRRCVL